MKRVTDWLGLVNQQGGPEGLLRPAESARERSRSLKAALELAAGVLGLEAEAFVVRTTGRINLMGMHIDHRGGAVNPIAIKDVFFVVRPREDDIIRAFNVERAFGRREFSITSISPPRGTSDWDSWTHAEHERRSRAGEAGDWSNYIRAPVAYVRFIEPERHLRGMDLFVAGDLPRASGLSSSSSIVVGAALACNAVNGLGFDSWKLVDVCGAGEWYVGTRGGSGDHAAIIFGRLDHVSHLGSFPLTVDHVPLPAGYSIVLANSLVEAKKTENARDVFNQRVACYELGLLLLRRLDERVRERAERLRDVNPETLGCSEAGILRLLKLLPEEAGREEVRRLLPGEGSSAEATEPSVATWRRREEDALDRVFRTHADVGPYRLRQVMAFGITECIRSGMAHRALEDGDVRLFGELVNISHEGDRVSRSAGGRLPRRPWRPELSDATLDGMIADLESGKRGSLWRLPGWYEVSCPELDSLADTARSSEGVAGAGRVGAGLGGAVVAVVREDSAEELLARLRSEYYEPRGLPPSAEVVRPLDGAGLVSSTVSPTPRRRDP